MRKRKKHSVILPAPIDMVQETVITSTPKDPNSPIVNEEEFTVIKNFFSINPGLQSENVENIPDYNFDAKEPWIQTHSGLRFTPLNPQMNAIVIQDIAHSLSMQCRFSGHIKRFYSVAQHSVLVSYICDSADALSGLLHDASEAYLVDLPSPLKRSGAFDNFKDVENNLMKLIFKRFNLPEVEPASVKTADRRLLYTEARDLLKVKRSDWVNELDPLPFKIDPLGPQQAKDLFMKRFYELTGTPSTYDHYLKYEYQ